MPKNHNYQYEKMNPQRLIRWSENIGRYSLLFTEKEFAKVYHKPNAYKKVVAVLSLAKIYGKTELELALMYAIDNNISKVKSIRSILDKKLYLQDSVNSAIYKKPSLFDNHSNIRGASEYL